jgi:hypothetical protein
MENHDEENKISTHTKYANTRGKKVSSYSSIFYTNPINGPQFQETIDLPGEKKPSRPEAAGTGTTPALPVSTLCQWSCTTNIDRSSAFYRH